MARIEVLDPTAPPPQDAAGAGPDAGTLAGRTVGIRVDRAWRSFQWVAEEWERELRGRGADVRLWTAGNRIGEEGERTRAELAAFADTVDVAVVGLGNRGSCTSWSVHDTDVVASRGKAAVVAVTAEFESLARTMAANAGRPAMRVLVLPYPLETRPEEDVRDVARRRFGSLLRTLGVRD